ncbi:CCA tRNA nucleotidyltransferase [Bacillus carboniphilus]|uniref:CCA-adding enzyme n=1 Tax=Bacillus carboniphilus TaxID=86663 RepID=A0ABY9JWD5_9BACI|nr:CCA tRNA nucleotidyltransferase [Bacillus carboniphilus]WLR43717.1 CCA tRNA nucleotidyltransferase [Bacillus carboniphilus]
MDKKFELATPIINKLYQFGFEAYFVGGAVRDYLIGREIADVDIATSATPDEMKKIFNRTIDVGAKHGTIVVVTKQGSFEVTTFRSEGTYINSRRPSKVTFISSLNEDLKRRDFTINAIAMTKVGDVIDFFGGKKDIEDGVIRTVGKPSDRFGEDALRMMRALRFASQLDFTIEKETKEAIIQSHSLLEDISIERKTAEIQKLFLGCNPQLGLRYLIETKVYLFLPQFSQNKTLLEKLLNVELKKLNNVEEVWSVLCLAMKISDIDLFLKKWKLSTKLIRSVKQLVKFVNKRLQAPLSNWMVYHLGVEQAIKVENILSIMENNQVKSDHEIKNQYNLLPIKERQELACDGKDLLSWFQSKKPGAWIEESIQAVEKQVVEGHLQNDKLLIKEWLISRANKSS